MTEWHTPDHLVRVTIEDGVAVIALANPAKRNCVSRDMSLAVGAAADYVNADPAVAATVLTGDGPVFSAGGDIDALANPSGPLELVYVGFNAIGKLVMPTIAAVNGPAVGAGVNFALACDVIVAARSAVFDPKFLDLAIHPGGGHLWRMNRLVGRQATAAMVIFGERVSAERAYEIGMVWSVVDDDELLGEAKRLAAKVAARPGQLVRRTKATLRACLPVTDERLATDLEQVQQEWSMAQPAYLEATSALLERMQGKA